MKRTQLPTNRKIHVSQTSEIWVSKTEDSSVVILTTSVFPLVPLGLIPPSSPISHLYPLLHGTLPCLVPSTLFWSFVRTHSWVRMAKITLYVKHWTVTEIETWTSLSKGQGATVVGTGLSIVENTSDVKIDGKTGR